MNYKTTLVLLALLALAAGYMVAWSRNWFDLREAPKVEDRVGNSLIENPPEALAIRRIELTRPDQPDVVLEEQGSDWQLVEPVRAAADRTRAFDLINLARDMKVAASYPADSEKTPSEKLTGLDQPRAVLVLVDRQGNRYRIAVGNQPAVSSHTYVKLGDDPRVYAVAGDPMVTLDASAESLRSRRLWDLTRDRIASVSLDLGEKGQLALDRPAADRPWEIVAPVRAPADQARVDALLGELASLTVAEWVGQGVPQIYGLSNPSLVAKLQVRPATPPSTQPQAEPAATTTRTVTFGLELQDKVYGQLDDQPALFAVNKADFEKLRQGLDALRRKKLLDVTSGEVSSLTLARPGGPTAKLIQDSNGDWQMTSPIDVPADNKTVEAIVSTLSQLEADQFVDDLSRQPLAERAIEQPQMTVAVGRGSGKLPAVLVIGQPTESKANVYVQNREYRSVALLPADKVQGLLVDPMALASREVWSLPAEQIQRIARRGQGQPRAVERIADDWQNWQLVEPVKMPADAELVRTLVEKLATLTSRQRTALAPAEAGLDKPTLTLTLTVREPQPTTQPADAPAYRTATRTLKLASKGDQLYAQPDDGPVYLLDRGLLDALTGEWARRTLVDRLNAASADALKLVSPLGTVELKRSDDKWQLASDPTVKIDAVKVQEVINNLSDLRVFAYVAFDAKQPGKFGLDKPTTLAEVRWPDGKTVAVRASSQGDRGGVYVTAGENVGLIYPAELLKIQKEWKFFTPDAR